MFAYDNKEGLMKTNSGKSQYVKDSESVSESFFNFFPLN
jgi:hypothetical protein